MRTDLFSFGAVLYEMATGQQAFTGTTSAEIREAILTRQATPPARLNPALNPRLQAIIEKALEKDRDVRYQHASDMRADLKRLKRDTDSERAVAPGLSPAYADVAAGSPRHGDVKSPLQDSDSQVIARLEKRHKKTLMALVASVFVVIAVAAGTYFYLGRRHSRRLSEQDTVVLADFTNQTGDPIWDDTLKQGLETTLRQSPFLKILSDDQVAATLRLMQRPNGTAVIGEVAREVCQRAGCRARILGSIAAVGGQYVLGLKAVGCARGETLAEEQATALGKGNVMDTLDQEAAKLREELGESLASVEKFDTPLKQATTGSIEALKAYSMGRKARSERGSGAALPFFQHAIELDPSFASAYASLGVNYNNLGQVARAREYTTKAFALRERASDWEKLDITALYYNWVTGELRKADQAYQEWSDNYPRDAMPYSHLADDRMKEGDYAACAEQERQALRLSPDDVVDYENLGWCLLALGRIDEVRTTFEEALSRKLDDDWLRMGLYGLAFLAGDTQGMASQAMWFEHRTDLQHQMFSGEADTEAYGGHLARARELTRRAVDAALRADSPESAAGWRVDAALREAAFGNTADGRREARAALKLAPDSRDVDVQAAVANAWTGDGAGARDLETDLKKRFPLDTLVNSYWLPTIEARLALTEGNPAGALERLQTVSPLSDLSSPIEDAASVCLDPVYTRGEAYLAAGQGSGAADEFQKILDHPGLVLNCTTGALARLGLARAYALEAGLPVAAVSDRRTEDGALRAPLQPAALAKARAAYQDFLTLWEDADPDIPILKGSQGRVRQAPVIFGPFTDRYQTVTHFTSDQIFWFDWPPTAAWPSPAARTRATRC